MPLINYPDPVEPPKNIFATYRVRVGLNELFGIRTEEESEVTSTSNNEGLGRPKIEALLNEDQNCFEKLGLPPKNPAKQKLVFASDNYYNAKKTNLTPQEHHYLQALIDTYELYVWDGSENALKKPVTDINDFLKKIQTISTDAKEEIKKKISDFSLPAQNYLIIDNTLAEKGEFLFIYDRPPLLYETSKVQKMKITKNHIKITVPKELEDHIERLEVSLLEISRNEERVDINFRYHYLKKLNELSFDSSSKIELSYPDEAFSLSRLRYEVFFGPDPFPDTFYSLVARLPTLKKLILLSEVAIFLDENFKSNTLTTLKITTRAENLNLKGFPKLETLYLTSDSVIKKNTGPYYQIKHLSLEYYTGQIDLSQFPNLESIVIGSLAFNIEKIDLSKNKKLRSVTIIQGLFDLPLVLTGLDKLEELNLTGVECIRGIETCKQLRALSFNELSTNIILFLKHISSQLKSLSFGFHHENKSLETALREIDFPQLQYCWIRRRKRTEQDDESQETSISGLNYISTINFKDEDSFPFSHPKMRHLETLPLYHEILRDRAPQLKYLEADYLETEASPIFTPSSNEPSPDQSTPIASYPFAELKPYSEQGTNLTEDTNRGNQEVTQKPKLLVGLSHQDRIISLDLLRTQVYDAVEYNKNTFRFRSSASLISKIYSLPSDQTCTAAYTGWMDGEFNKDTIYFLPSDHPLEKNDLLTLNSDPPLSSGDIVFCYHPHTQQYSFQLQTDYQGKLIYHFSENKKEYDAPLLKTSHVPSAIKIRFSKEINEALHDVIENNLVLFQIQKMKNTKQKIDWLISYFSSFTKGSLSTHSSDQLELLKTIIKEKKGACETRSQAFFLLANYLGIPTRYVGNVLHAYCEIAEKTSEEEIEWHRVNLSGTGEISYAFNYTPPTLPSKSALQTPLTLEEIPTEPSNPYSPLFEKLTTINTVEKIETLFSPEQLLVPLLQIATQFSAKEMNQFLFHHSPKIYQENYFYIDSPTDFAHFFKAFRINEQGRRDEIPGPLKRLFNSKNPGVLVVNWSSFNETSLGSYQTIMDKPPTLLGVSIPPSVQIIGLTDTDTPSCSAFDSRCIRCRLDSSLFENHSLAQATSSFTSLTSASESASAESATSASISTASPLSYPSTSASDSPVSDSDSDLDITPHPSTKIFTLDLSGRRDWKELLAGCYIIKNNLILKEPGLLDKLTEKNTLLKILNPPDSHFDPEFHRFLYELQTAGRYLFDGEFHFISPNCQIEVTSTKLSDLTSTAQISWLKDEKLNGRHCIHLNLNNLHLCYEILKVDEEKQQAQLIPGWLDKFDPIQDVFWITEDLPLDFLQGLYNEIKKQYPNKTFYFALAPGVALENGETGPSFIPQQKTIIPSSAEIQAQSETHAVLMSNDPDLLVSDLKTQIPEAIIIDFTPQTNSVELFSRLHLQVTAEGTVKAEIKKETLLENIEKGKTVILNGKLSSELYRELLPLFESDNELYYNGEFLPIKGKLICVMPLGIDNTLPLRSSVQCNYELEDYCQRLGIEKTDPHFQNFKRFYEAALKFPHHTPSSPLLSISFERFKKIMSFLKNPPERHRHNPIKGLFLYDYPKSSPEYSYLNVLAKYYFDHTTPSPSDNGIATEKLEPLLQKIQQAGSPQERKKKFDELLWEILNCLDGENLREMLPEVSFPHLEKEAKELLLNTFNTAFSSSKTSQHLEKNLAYLNAALKENKNFFLFIKGEPGIGKTHALRQGLKEKYTVYDGIQNLEGWVKDAGNQNKEAILLLDEANMAEPGTWDKLKFLARAEENRLSYQGKNYPLHHRIIFTGNPETFQQRYYHPLLQHYAETLYFQKPTKSERIEITKKCLAEHPDLQMFAILLVASCEIFDSCTSDQHKTSLRDLENLTLRILSTFKNSHNQSEIKSLFYKACLAEFAWAFPDAKQTQNFKVKLDSLFFQLTSKNVSAQASSSSLLVNHDLFFPHRRRDFIDALRQDLHLREYATEQAKQNQNAPPLFFKSIILEGDAGLGKSTLLKALLQEENYVPATEDNKHESKRYYEISAGSSETAEILKKAYHEGAAVILDELNLDERLEALLNQYLCNPLSDCKPGFMILASQNPSYFEGRHALSPALLNRLHVLHMPNYKKEELLEIASHHRVPEPEKFVAAYLQEKERGKANTRTFFTAMNEQKTNVACNGAQRNYRNQ